MTPAPRSDLSGIVPPPLILGLSLLLGWGLGQIVDDPGLGIGWDVRRYIAFGGIALGILIDGAATAHFRRLGTRPEPWKPTTALATDGLYRFSRNPIYIGFALIYLGVVAAVDSLFALALLIPAMVLVDRLAVVREERYLAARFGAAWDAYRSKVRRWL